MLDDPLPYDLWVEESLRGVVRRALTHTEQHGLSGDHHFYITFRTEADGVEIPGHLHAQHPEEMTIILQHQFSDLRVGKDLFEVTLSFSGKAEYLCIPFEAITSFADPSVNFGLQLKISAPAGVNDLVADGGNDDPVTLKPAPQANKANKTDKKDTGDTGDTGAEISDGDKARSGDGAHSNPTTGPNTGPNMGEVIALDAFRKK